MRVLFVTASPEPTSLTSSLAKVAEEQFRKNGHETQTSNLYEMGWKATVDRSDFLDLAPEQPLRIVYNSYDAFHAGKLADDVLKEQEKLDWADALIWVYPMWWFQLPAILKGWFERVFTAGFGYRTGEYSATKWDNRYGSGRFEGKRAMCIIQIGGRESNFSATGINGPVDDLMFPVTHGMLFYTGYAVLPSFVTHGADRVNDESFADIAKRLRKQIDEFQTTKSIPYRRQNFGDYHIPSLELKEELVDPNKQSFALHQE